MKKLFYLAVMVLMCTSCSCNIANKDPNFSWFTFINGKGALVTRDYDFKDFDAIRINGDIDVRFLQAETFRVALRTQENIFDYIDLRVEGTTLVAEPEWDKVNGHFIRMTNYRGLDLTIYAPYLRDIDIRGDGDLAICHGYVSDGDLIITLYGDGDIDLAKISVQSLTLGIEGDGDAELSGIHAKSLKINNEGDGSISISGEAEEASLTINGDGDVDISNLKVKDPEKKHVHVSGDGNIQL